MIEDFKVGDEVIFIGNFCPSLNNQVGIILEIGESGSILCLFKDWYKGHGGGMTKYCNKDFPSSHYWVKKEHLQHDNVIYYNKLE